MTTKELIQQYVTAHSDNRWMDASELETLLTEFAEKLKEPASEELEVAARRYVRPLNAIGIRTFKAGSQWKEKQMMKNAIDAHVNMEWNHLSLGGFAWSQTGLDLGDKCKLIIIKE